MVDVFYPLQWIADQLTYEVLGIAPDTRLAASVNFVIYDVMKIFVLLAVMIFIVSYMRTYITPERTRQVLGSKQGIRYYVLASLIGTVTPFCSCSSVPIFIGFVEAGVPLGVTFAFLITSPLINEAAVAALWATLGLKATVMYVISGVALGVLGGYLIGHLKLERYVEDFVYKMKVGKQSTEDQKLTIKERVDFAFESVKEIVGRVWLYVIIGVTIGGIFHGYAPEGILEKYAGEDNLLAVPIAVLIGVPLYSNVMAMIPIVESLIGKGLPVGTALAFLMSVTAVSLPEMIILRKVLKKELIAIFVSIVAVSIIFTGYLFNMLL
ncbi:MAG TPA: permease [Methanosarcina thermophila]|uniref:Transporter n=2 Tax=Methanosarcina thermophila TaxID=2210 RepID=A0A3G9CWI6_METTE|nr:permease [Methanosarcina thermophila]AKB12672.1 Transporter [Methanosarcina thermophila TM-1]BAW30406.1 transporter [Methanosarcina thermophila]HOA68819.1 permease [Methanosarcina thermophila]HOQ64871.1 permease [Methanosarcina thermophila]HPT80912.1 permease [Methanosarcina thermophila]